MPLLLTLLLLEGKNAILIESKMEGGEIVAVFITGDTHGDFSRLTEGVFVDLDGLSREDYLLICGDFGGIWDGKKKEQKQLDWLESRPFTTLFVSGNHENYDLLAQYPEKEWQGGRVQVIRPHILHLMRGQVFTLEGKTFFTMGGARSHDISDGILERHDPDLKDKEAELRAAGALFRINRLTWWRQELPSGAEYQTARENLEKHGWAVDYIVTHCAPSAVQKALLGEKAEADPLTDFLEEVRQRCCFDCWFFGHYHDDKAIGGKFALLYEEIVQVC